MPPSGVDKVGTSPAGPVSPYLRRFSPILVVGGALALVGGAMLAEATRGRPAAAPDGRPPLQLVGGWMPVARGDLQPMAAPPAMPIATAAPPTAVPAPVALAPPPPMASPQPPRPIDMPPPGEMPAVGGPVPHDRPWDWTGAATGGSPGTDPLPFMEGHWQGLEVLPLWPTLRTALGIPATASGVVVDEITQPADGQGFAAGDLVMVVGRLPTPTVADFLAAADVVRETGSVDIVVLRGGEVRSLVLSAAPRLGTANGETAPMIPPGAPRPHAYLGPCTNCHRIGTNGSMPVDPGDLFQLTAPPIRAGQRATHRDFGPCRACHTIQ